MEIIEIKELPREETTFDEARASMESCATNHILVYERTRQPGKGILLGEMCWLGSTEGKQKNGQWYFKKIFSHEIDTNQEATRLKTRLTYLHQWYSLFLVDEEGYVKALTDELQRKAADSTSS